jgi:transposase-like protein
MARTPPPFSMPESRTLPRDPRLTAGVCIIHLIRNTFRLASRRDWDALKRDVKPIYTAVNAVAARAALEELTEK